MKVFASSSSMKRSFTSCFAAFLTAFTQLHRRISVFICVPFGELDAMAIRRELDGIGRLREKGQ